MWKKSIISRLTYTQYAIWYFIFDQVVLAFPESQKMSFFLLDDSSGRVSHVETYFFFLPNCLSISSHSHYLTFINHSRIVSYNLLSRFKKTAFSVPKMVLSVTNQLYFDVLIHNDTCLQVFEIGDCRRLLKASCWFDHPKRQYHEEIMNLV